jgi:hypothetical protein
MKLSTAFLLLLLWANVGPATAQTSDFTYQGKLTQSSLPANSNYDFEFKLFNAAAGGTLADTKQRDNVSVANGVFNVRLDFAPALFDGADRYLEIGVRQSGSGGGFQQLLPRQQITSTPYAVRSLNATNSSQLGGVAASQYVLTSDSRLTDSRTPLPNSTSYIQNTNSQQAASNFNISGNGVAGGTVSANRVNAETQYNLGGFRVLHNPGPGNLFVGVGAGSDTTGNGNSFFGSAAGRQNTTGNSNSFFGNLAGGSNSTGSHNSFFGGNAGFNNTGDSNSFFGSGVGFANTTGQRNSFFGDGSGDSNTSGNDNAFFGYHAGAASSANNNSFFGSEAGNQNQTGFNNAFFGRNAGRANTTGNGNSYFGNGAGINSGSSSANSFFGNGAGSSNISGGSNSFFGNAAGNTNANGTNNTVIGAGADVASAALSFATAIGAFSTVSSSNTIALGRSDGSDRVVVYGLGAAGSTDICRNASNQISTCSSSLRYKTQVEPFTRGLNLVNRLQPITFTWTDGGLSDVGFAAEDVARVEPLLVVYNHKGEIEGVRYKQLTAVLVNAIREQQAQIESQEKHAKEQDEKIETQQKQIAALQKLVCLTQPNADICK